MILGLQLIAIVFAFVMIYFANLHFRRNELSRDEIAFWMLIWVGVIIVVVFPEALRRLAMNFFITRLFDLLVVGGFFLVISMSATLYIKTKRLENKLERIIREDALSKLENTPKKTPPRKLKVKN